MWHYRFGHPAHRTVQCIISRFSLPVVKNKTHVVCGACQQAKSQQLPFPDSTFHSNAPLDLIFFDVWGLPPFALLMDVDIMLALWIIFLNLLGCFLSSSNLML